MATLNTGLGPAAANDTGRQLFTWGILYGLISAVFGPVANVISEEAWVVMVNQAGHRALSPPELAVMVVRGWMTADQAAGEAKKNGVQGSDFDKMVAAARNPIAPQEAAVALRRKLIPETAAPGDPSFENAIRQGNTGDQWGPVIKELATAQPSPADILNAVLQGQVPAGLDPRVLYQAVGGELVNAGLGVDWYELMFNTRGSAPTPMEALDMVKRRAIPWGDGRHGDGLVEGPGALSYHQAFLEGPWRNKWEPAFDALYEYIPPPRSVVAMLHNGSISVAQATDWLTRAGLPAATIDAYVHDATRTRTAKAKELTEAQVLGLLNDKLIDQPTAVQYLEQLGYPANEATTLASTGQAAASIRDLNANLARVRSYFIAHKINRSTAQTELGNLGLPPDRVASLLAGWDVDRRTNVRTLTAAQIENAWEFGIMTEAEARSELEVLGYTALDAWTLLSIKAKAPLANKPAGTTALTP